MDPDEALRKLRMYLSDRQWAERHDNDEIRQTSLEGIAEHAEALDAWLSQGGFPPQKWRRVRTLSQPEADRVARVVFAISREARDTGFQWHDLYPKAQHYWQGVASTAIHEYLLRLGYDLIPFENTPRPEPPQC